MPAPTAVPFPAPSSVPTLSVEPSGSPTALPSLDPTSAPTITTLPTAAPTGLPTLAPTSAPSIQPSAEPTGLPSPSPTTLQPTTDRYDFSQCAKYVALTAAQNAFADADTGPVRVAGAVSASFGAAFTGTDGHSGAHERPSPPPSRTPTSGPSPLPVVEADRSTVDRSKQRALAGAEQCTDPSAHCSTIQSTHSGSYLVAVDRSKQRALAGAEQCTDPSAHCSTIQSTHSGSYLVAVDRSKQRASLPQCTDPSALQHHPEYPLRLLLVAVKLPDLGSTHCCPRPTQAGRTADVGDLRR